MRWADIEDVVSVHRRCGEQMLVMCGEQILVISCERTLVMSGEEKNGSQKIEILVHVFLEIQREV